MVPAKRTCFRNIFRAAADGVDEVLYTSRSTTASAHWEKWAPFGRYVALNPQLVLYRYLVPVLNTFARQYRDGSISPVRCKLQSFTVEDSVCSIGQALAALGTRDPRLRIQG